MRITILGSGTSHGIPVIGCDCAVCHSTDSRNQRMRPSLWIETNQVSVVIDATPDFRFQALRARIRRVDAVVLTHTHADHFMGLDDLRVFTERQKMRLPVYGSTGALKDVERVFPYALVENPSWPTMPRFTLQVINPGEPLTIGDLHIQAVTLPHGRGTVLGFIFNGQFAYLTDCHTVPAEVVAAVKGLPVVVLDALRHRPHPTHMTIAQACEAAAQIGAGTTYFTHLCHEVDHATIERELPASIRLAYDGLVVEFPK